MYFLLNIVNLDGYVLHPKYLKGIIFCVVFHLVIIFSLVSFAIILIVVVSVRSSYRRLICVQHVIQMVSFSKNSDYGLVKKVFCYVVTNIREKRRS